MGKLDNRTIEIPRGRNSGALADFRSPTLRLSHSVAPGWRVIKSSLEPARCVSGRQQDMLMRMRFAGVMVKRMSGRIIKEIATIALRRVRAAADNVEILLWLTLAGRHR